MMKKEMSIDKVLLEKDRMLKYKSLSMAFSYPDEVFFEFFGEFSLINDELISEYDRLFRTEEIWLYGAEYSSENEFQRVNNIADIVGFYKAFGLEVNKERPDLLSTEFEFMHYLIFKRIYAIEKEIDDKGEKVLICYDAEKKFFSEHIYNSATKIAKTVLQKSENDFYVNIAKEMIDFLEQDKKYLGVKK